MHPHPLLNNFLRHWLIINGISTNIHTLTSYTHWRITTETNRPTTISCFPLLDNNIPVSYNWFLIFNGTPDDAFALDVSWQSIISSWCCFTLICCTLFNIISQCTLHTRHIYSTFQDNILERGNTKGSCSLIEMSTVDGISIINGAPSSNKKPGSVVDNHRSEYYEVMFFPTFPQNAMYIVYVYISTNIIFTILDILNT